MKYLQRLAKNKGRVTCNTTEDGFVSGKRDTCGVGVEREQGDERPCWCWLVITVVAGVIVVLGQVLNVLVVCQSSLHGIVAHCECLGL